ncbi:MAG: hypothetical protein WDO18_22705 [Acidobacteriota bacterium]
MNRKVVFLNVVLGILLIWIGVRLRAHWQEASERKNVAMSRPAHPSSVAAPPAAPGVEAPSAVQYLDVAQKMLFSKDRNPIEILPPPPPPKVEPPPPPKPPVPPMPHYYGQMDFGEPVLLMSPDGKIQKSYHKGDKVGDFEIVEFDDKTVTLTWNGDTFLKEFRELTKEPERVAQVAAAAPAPAGGRTIIGAGPAPSAGQQKSIGPTLGEPQGNLRNCVAGDNSPDGTILDGFRLKKMDNLFGSTCQWEPLKP